jgi:hypothetical protein
MLNKERVNGGHVLGLTALTAKLKPALGYTARILMMIGVAGFAAIISGEMLASRLVLDGAETAWLIARASI